MALPAAGGGGPQGFQDANLLQVAEYLFQHGYSRAAAAGIAGTIAGESGGNPESQGSGGRGLIGWTPPSTLPNSAFTGNAQHDLIAQAAEIIVYNQKNDPGSIHQLNSFTDPVKAADFYSRVFERPAVPLSDVRPDVASWVFGRLTGTGGTAGSVRANVPGSQGISQDLFGGIAGDLFNPVLSSLGVSSLTDLFERAFLIIVGIVLVIFGVIKLGQGGHRSSNSRGGSNDSVFGTDNDGMEASSSAEKAFDKAEKAGELSEDKAAGTGKHEATGHVRGRRSIAMEDVLSGNGKARQAPHTAKEFGKAGPVVASEVV